MNNSKVIHHLSLTNSNAQENIIKDSIANPNLPIHNIEELKDFLKLILYDSITCLVLSGLQILEQLHHVHSEVFIIHVRHDGLVV